MEQMTQLLAQHGVLLVFASVFVAQVGIPVPAVPVLIVAGAFVGNGQLSLAPVLVVAVIASLCGDTPWYYAGRRFGYGILRTLCRIAIEPDSCVKQTESIFERWGAPSLMVAKFIPGFATVAPPLAGTLKLPLPRFLAYSAVAALLWAGVPVITGMVLHAEVQWAITRLEDMGLGALLLLGAIVTLYAAVKATERYLLIRFLRMVRITVGELRAAISGGAKPVVLDVRSASARRYDPRRIPGAIAVDINQPERHLAAVSPDEDVIVYCS